MIKVLCGRLRASRSAAREETRTPAVAAVKMTPVSIGLYPRTEVDGDGERRSQEDQPLGVLRDQGEIRRPVPEQSGAEQRLLSRSFACADVEEEPDQERDSDGQEEYEEEAVGIGLQDPQHDE
jgi:hypothetical protein